MFTFLQGFTYIAPSVLEDIYKPQIGRSRSPRKSGSTPLRHHFGLNIHHNVHHLGHLGPHQSNLGLLNQHALNCDPDEMMEISSVLPHHV